MTQDGVWIVMTSAKRGINYRYRNVAVVKITRDMFNENKKPRMISERARGVIEVKHLGCHNVGLGKRSAYTKAVEEAEGMAKRLNEQNA